MSELIFVCCFGKPVYIQQYTRSGGNFSNDATIAQIRSMKAKYPDDADLQREIGEVLERVKD